MVGPVGSGPLPSPGAIVFDDDHRILGWDRGMEKLTGLPAESVLGRPCWDVIRAVDGAGVHICRPDCALAAVARTWDDAPTVNVFIAGQDVCMTTSRGVVDSRPVFFHVICPSSTAAVLDKLDALTPRQLEVLRLLGDGLATREIAAQLGIAYETVRNHVRAILRVLAARSRVEAVVKAYRLGLIAPSADDRSDSTSPEQST